MHGLDERVLPGIITSQNLGPEQMKFFIAEMTYLAPIETIREGYTAHRAWLQKGYDLGMFLCSGPKSDPPVGGYLVARAESKDELEEMFAQEPFNKAGR